MATPYPANILTGGAIHLSGLVDFTDPANQPGGSLPVGTVGQFLYASAASAYTFGRPLAVIDAAKEYGVDFTGGIAGSDQGPAINNAVNAGYAISVSGAAPGCIVQLPPGVGRTNTPIVVKGGVWLRGHGPTTTGLTLYNDDWGAKGSIVTMDATQSAAKVSDLFISAAIRNTSVLDGTMVGIDCLAGVPPFSSGGVYSQLENVIVMNTTSSGVKWQTLEGRIRNVMCRTYPGSVSVPGFGAGFHITGTDNLLSNCTADTCGGLGFLAATSNTKFSNCKAFGCGQFSGGNALSSGWWVTGTRNMFAACEAQDNYGFGFFDNGTGNVWAACVADTNNVYGFYLVGNSVATSVYAINRSGTPQTYGYRADVSGGGNQWPTIIGSSAAPGTADVYPGSVGTIIVNHKMYTTRLVTADPHVAGQWWANSGVVTVSAG